MVCFPLMSIIHSLIFHFSLQKWCHLPNTAWFPRTSPRTMTHLFSQAQGPLITIQHSAINLHLTTANPRVSTSQHSTMAMVTGVTQCPSILGRRVGRGINCFVSSSLYREFMAFVPSYILCLTFSPIPLPFSFPWFLGEGMRTAFEVILGGSVEGRIKNLIVTGQIIEIR